MFAALDCLVSPSAVSHALHAKLNGRRSLIIIKSNLLEVYELSHDNQMILRYQHHLYDHVIDAVVIPSPTDVSNSDRLLISFRDAKAVIISFDNIARELQASSLHCYERAEYLGTSFKLDAMPKTIVRVDPALRCSLVSVYDEWISLLLPEDLADELLLDNTNKLNKTPSNTSLSSKLIKTSSIDERVKNVRDVVFLPGFLEPTIAVLFITNQTTVTRLELVKDTACVIIASIDLRKQTFSTIAHWEGLPYDSDRLIPLPASLKGLLVLSGNAMIHLEPGTPGHGLSVNSFTERSTAFRMQSKSHH